MIVGIAGHGFVGKAVGYGCDLRGIQKRIYDPYVIPENTIEVLSDADVVFVCVPTPPLANGHVDDSIVRSVCLSLAVMKYDGVVAIKSTLRPDLIAVLRETYNKLRIVANPEFLTERTSRDDFVGAPFAIIGGDDADTNVVARFLKMINVNTKIRRTTPEMAMMAKYVTNSFFSVKIAYMNEIKLLWDELGYEGDWDALRDIFLADERISHHHTRVPGPDGRHGFGGKCLPKDTMGIASLLEEHHIPAATILGALKTNEAVRDLK